jgi:hypothetical protein
MGVMPRNATGSGQTAKRSAITLFLFGLVLLSFVGEAPIQFDYDLYSGEWRSFLVVITGPLLSPIPGISLTPWQLLLVAFVPFCLGKSARQLHSPEMDRAIFVSLACVACTFAWGLINGGSAYFAYYQLWHYLAALLLAYMLMSALRSEDDLVLLGKMVVFAALIRSTLCMYYYWAHLRGMTIGFPQFVTNHDDSMLFVTAIEIAVIWAILKHEKKAWGIAVLVSLYILYAMALNRRRIAWLELAFALPVMYVLMGPGPLRTRINKWLMVLAPLGLAYFIAGTLSTSQLFAPVHAFVTAGSTADASSLTREEEIRNLLRTLVDYGNPILGTGWGLPYHKLESFFSNYSALWTLVLYTPHNSVVGVAAYSGLVGMFGIWGVVPISGFLAARGYRNSSSKVVQATAMTAIGAICSYSAHCYGDIGFQSFEGAVILGTALAAAGRVAAWKEAVPATKTAVTKAAVHRAARRAPSLRPRKLQPRTGRHTL